MTQTERLYYYLDKINSDPILKEEVYENCDPKLLPPEMLEEQLSWLLEGGCKQDYSLVPFADDGSGGVYVIVDDFEKKKSEILNKFQQEENMDMEYETVYKKLVKGLLLYPVFEIDPTDDEYCKSENLLRIDDEEFYALCREHK